MQYRLSNLPIAHLSVPRSHPAVDEHTYPAASRTVKSAQL